MDQDEIIKKLKEKFGSRIEFLGYQILMLTSSGQPCDITFYKKPPVINVEINKQIVLAIMYGAGPEKLMEMLKHIKLSTGETINIEEIWVINPMPVKGFAKEELENVDLLEGEKKFGPNGETLRKMIRDTYKCKNKDEEDYYLRRFLAS